MTCRTASKRVNPRVSLPLLSGRARKKSCLVRSRPWLGQHGPGCCRGRRSRSGSAQRSRQCWRAGKPQQRSACRLSLRSYWTITLRSGAQSPAPASPCTPHSTAAAQGASTANQTQRTGPLRAAAGRAAASASTLLPRSEFQFCADKLLPAYSGL